MITRLKRCDALPDFKHNARALMAKNTGEKTLRIIPRAGKLIGVAHACGLDLDEDFALLGAFKLDFHNLKWLACCKRDGCTCSHDVSPKYLGQSLR
jgi:hypothetical protein